MFPKKREAVTIKCEWLKRMKDAAEKADLNEMARIRDEMKATLVSQLVAPVIAQKRADAALSQAMNFLKV